MHPSSSQIGHEGKYAIKIFFTLFKGPNPSYLVLTFAGNCLSSNWDFTQNVNLQGHDLENQGHLWRSRIFCKNFPQSTHEHTCEVSLRSHQQFFLENLRTIFPKVDRRRKKQNCRRNSFTDVDILWYKLCNEEVIWHNRKWPHKIWRSFPERSFAISWVSIHWAVIVIELPKLCLKSTWIAIAKQ